MWAVPPSSARSSILAPANSRVNAVIAINDADAAGVAELRFGAARGREAEHRAAGRVKVEGHLSRDQWAGELSLVLNEMHALLWPDLIVLCGGITKEQGKFMSKLRCEARLCVGTLRSEAGIVGAALATLLPAAVNMR